MTVLVDTHAFYWSLCSPAELSQAALRIFTDTNVRKVLSVASFWEMTIKSGLGKLKLPRPVEHLWAEAEDAGIVIAGIAAVHLRRLSDLPRHHGDPFDRLVISQALEEEWALLSKDSEFDAYGVQRIW